MIGDGGDGLLERMFRYELLGNGSTIDDTFGMGCITGGTDRETVFLGQPGICCHLLSKVSICFLRNGE